MGLPWANWSSYRATKAVGMRLKLFFIFIIVKKLNLILKKKILTPSFFENFFSSFRVRIVERKAFDGA